MTISAIMSSRDAPPTPEAATARIAELKGNPEWSAKYLGGDRATLEEFTRLNQALYPAPAQTSSADDVLAQLPARAAAEAEKRLAYYSSRLDLNATQREEIRQNRPINAETQTWARNQIARLKSDQEFIRKYLSGDAEATDRFGKLHLIVTAPTYRPPT